MPLSISLADEQSALPVTAARVRNVVRTTLRAEGVADAIISIALVDDPAIHIINRRHLEHDYPTDVLSFRLSEEGAERLEGEVIASTETAVRQGAEFGWGGADELTLYLVHGLLHLCGYDDHKPRDRAAMRRREREILQNWGLTPHYGD